jgi:large subunit ribosomal protein L24
MPKLKIRKGDHVVVITGKDKGKRGEVLKVMPQDNRAIVKGVAIMRKHQKQSATQDGGIISKEAAVNISNIALEDPKDGKPTRVGYKFLKDGRKVRFAKRSGEVIDG